MPLRVVRLGRVFFNELPLYYRDQGIKASLTAGELS